MRAMNWSVASHQASPKRSWAACSSAGYLVGSWKPSKSSVIGSVADTGVVLADPDVVAATAGNALPRDMLIVRATAMTSAAPSALAPPLSTVSLAEVRNRRTYTATATSASTATTMVTDNGTAIACNTAGAAGKAAGMLFLSGKEHSRRVRELRNPRSLGAHPES
jgi:hypothetical protein